MLTSTRTMNSEGSMYHPTGSRLAVSLRRQPSHQPWQEWDSASTWRFSSPYLSAGGHYYLSLPYHSSIWNLSPTEGVMSRHDFLFRYFLLRMITYSMTRASTIRYLRPSVRVFVFRERVHAVRDLMTVPMTYHDLTVSACTYDPEDDLRTFDTRQGPRPLHDHMLYALCPHVPM